MADHGQYFDESDPEWSVAQLAARRAPGFVQQPRRLPPRAFLTAAVTVLLAVGVTGPVLSRTTGQSAPPPVRESQPMMLGPATTPSPVEVRQPVAPQATLTAVAPTPHKPGAPVSPPSRETEVTKVVARPLVSPAVAKPKPKPAQQVGPNKQLAHPIDPDDR